MVLIGHVRRPWQHPPAVETDLIRLGAGEAFDPIRYYKDRYSPQPDLARLTPGCSFNSAKILLSDRRLRLRRDIFAASECL